MPRASLIWLVALPLMGQQIGEILTGVFDLPVSPRAGSAAALTLRGSPAIVIAREKDGAGRTWIRLLAADGSSGWTSRTLHGQPARIIAPTTLDLSPHAPGDPAFSPSDDLLSVAAAQASVTGSSRVGRVSSPEQLKIPAWLNPFLGPWLKVQAASTAGWIAPSEVEFAWGQNPSGQDLDPAADALGLEGIVRSPFLGALGRTLAAQSPSPGQALLRFEDIQSQSTPGAVPAGTPTWNSSNLFLRSARSLISFPGSLGTAFVFPHLGLALVAQGHPTVVEYRLADLDGDRQPELLLQLVSTYGDGYTTALWIVDGAASQNGSLRITAVTLGGSSGEPGGSTVDAKWWADAPGTTARSTVWISRAQHSRVEFAALDYTASAASATKAYAVVAGEFSTTETAAAKAILLSGKAPHSVAFFPWTANERGVKSWAAGRLFRDRDDAVAWRKQAALPESSLRQILLKP